MQTPGQGESCTSANIANITLELKAGKSHILVVDSALHAKVPMFNPQHLQVEPVWCSG